MTIRDTLEQSIRNSAAYHEGYYRMKDTDTTEAMRAAFEADFNKHHTFKAGDFWHAEKRYYLDRSGPYDDFDIQERWEEFQRAWQAATARQTVPDGYKLVPIEPTEEMLSTMHSTVQILVNPWAKTADIQNDKVVWEAVIAAAPDNQEKPMRPYTDEEIEDSIGVIELDGREDEICECISRPCRDALIHYMKTTRYAAAPAADREGQ